MTTPLASRIGVVLAMVVSALPQVVFAQEKLTLDDVLIRAAEYNPAYRQALNNLELAGIERRTAIGAFLPSVNLNMNTSLNANRQLTVNDNFGNPVDNPITEWRTSSGSGQGISLSMDLFQGFTRFHQFAVNKATATGRAMDAAANLASTQASLRRDFNGALQQSALLEIERQARIGRVQDLERTRELLRLADVDLVDVRRAELEIVRQDRAISAGETAHRQALLRLNAAVGDPALPEFGVEGVEADPFDPSRLDLESLVGVALDQNPGIRSGMAGVARDAAGLKNAKGARWPSLSLTLSGNQSATTNGSTAFFDPFSDRSRSGGLSFGLSIPVFSGFQTSSNIASSGVALRNTELALRQLELDTERDVRSQFLQLEDAWIAYQTNLRARDIAEEVLRLAREDYQVAIMDFTDLQIAISSAQGERRNVITSRFDFLNALINLEEAVGTGVVSVGQRN